MKVNRNVEVALASVEALALASKPVTVASLATVVGTTENFLEQVVRRLRLKGITGAVRGPGGGVTLAKPGVTALEITEALGYHVQSGSAFGSATDKLKSRLYSALQETRVGS